MRNPTIIIYNNKWANTEHLILTLDSHTVEEKKQISKSTLSCVFMYERLYTLRQTKILLFPLISVSKNLYKFYMHNSQGLVFHKSKKIRDSSSRNCTSFFHSFLQFTFLIFFFIFCAHKFSLEKLQIVMISLSLFFLIFSSYILLFFIFLVCTNNNSYFFFLFKFKALFTHFHPVFIHYLIVK